jgi:hypothetical protein
MPIAQMRGRTARSVGPAGVVEERSMTIDYARGISFLKHKSAEMKSADESCRAPLA